MSMEDVCVIKRNKTTVIYSRPYKYVPAPKHFVKAVAKSMVDDLKEYLLSDKEERG